MYKVHICPFLSFSVIPAQKIRLLTVRWDTGQWRAGAGKWGRLEVWRDGEWGTVCANGFDDNDARVVCRTLGFSGGEKYSSSMSYYAMWAFDPNREASEPELGVAGSGRIWLNAVDCSGSEASFFDCPKVANPANWGKHGCAHGNDVFMKCT